MSVVQNRPKSAYSKMSNVSTSAISTQKTVSFSNLKRPKSAKKSSPITTSAKFNGTNSAMTFEEWTKKVEHRKLKEKQAYREAEKAASNSKLSKTSLLTDSKSRSTINFHEDSVAKGSKGVALETGEYALIRNNDQKTFCYSKNERSSIELKKKLKVLNSEYQLKLRSLDNRIKNHYIELQKLDKDKYQESKQVKVLNRQFSNQRKIQMARFEKLNQSALRRSSIEMQKQFCQTNLVGKTQSSPEFTSF